VLAVVVPRIPASTQRSPIEKPMSHWFKTWRAKYWKQGLIPPVLAPELTPHVVFFSTPENFHHETLKVNGYKGLLYSEALGGPPGNQGRLLTVWRDQRAYAAVKTRFLEENGLGTDTPWEGFHLGTRQPKPYLTPARIWAAIAALVTIFFLVLGRAKEIRDASGWMVGPPVIEASTPSAVTDVLVGEAFKFQVMVRNTRSFGDCFIEFIDPPEHPSSVQLEPLSHHTVPAINPNHTATVTVSGTAPRKEGEYKIVVKGRATAGWIPSDRPFEQSALLKVWPLCEFKPHTVKGNGKRCVAEFELHSGQAFPTGLDVQVRLDRVPGVQFTVVSFRETPQWVPFQNWDEPGKEVAGMEWSTPPIVAKEVILFTLVLESNAEKGKTSDEWQGVVKDVYFRWNKASQRH
jgi:hypothetical protein